MAAPEIHGYADFTPIGRGGYAVVYRARQVALNRQVAVKVLGGAAADPTKLARFERECAAVGGLSGHPHVVAVYDAGVTTDGSPYLAMEYIKGGTLADRLRLEGPRPPAEVIHVGAQISDAIEVAHQAGLLHRDIKPENVLLDAAGRAKIADFGIAATADSGDTATGVILGTVLHTAPEVIEGRRASVASDVYSLGSLLATLLLGRPPFAGPSDESPIPAMMRVVRDPLPDLRAVGVPDELATVIETAMARMPEHRYPSAAALAAALRRLPDGGGPSEGGADEERPTIPPTPRLTAVDAGSGWAPTSPTEFDGAVTTMVETPFVDPVRRRRPVLANVALLIGLLLVAVGAVAVGWAVDHSGHSTPPPTSAVSATTTTTASSSSSIDGPGPVATTEAEAVTLVEGRYPTYRITGAGGWQDGGSVAALVGTRTDGRQQVFLFAGGHLFGRDFADPSWSVSVVSVAADTVTVRYGLYAAGESPPAAAIRSELVDFHFDGTHFAPPASTQIPSTDVDRDGHR